MKLLMVPPVWLFLGALIFSKVLSWRIARDLALILEDFQIYVEKEQRKKWSTFIDLFLTAIVFFFGFAYSFHLLVQMYFQH